MRIFRKHACLYSLLGAVALVSAGAFAQVRVFPEGTAVGAMQPPVDGAVVMGGRTLRLAPGVQFRGKDNLIVLPAAVREAVKVRYQLDMHGDVARVWLLSPDEAMAADRMK